METYSNEREEKRAIMQRLTEYRAANGLGCLEKLSVKTAHNRRNRISPDSLRSMLNNNGSPRPIEQRRKIGRALEILEGEAHGGK